MWYKSTGRLIYDPYRGNMANKVDWWAIINVDKEITRYYRWWIERNPSWFNSTHIDIKNPSWNAHISVIRGEKPSNDLIHLWNKYQGEKIDFWYDGMVRQSGDTIKSQPDNYFFVEVHCPRIVEIRKELNRPTNWSSHLTVGRIY